MSNVTNIATKQHSGDTHTEGMHLWNLLEAERWTYRKLEARTGIKVGVISSRMRGVTPLTVDEIQTFAAVLGRNPVELYAELVDAKENPHQNPDGGNEPPAYTV